MERFFAKRGFSTMSKRKYLAGLAAAVAVVTAGVATTHAKNVYEENTGSYYSPADSDSLLSSLLMEEKESTDINKTSAHSSHASHGSHASHASHSSHSSGY